MKRVFDWLHARTGYRAAAAHFLDEHLPPGTAWWFTLGSVLLFLLLLQAATGAALALYYAPTPDHAYESVQFIMRDVAFGSLVRALHFFGASAVVIVAVLHLLRVIAFGSYKAPREATWLTGIVLLLIVLGFALTGYLLPWDQRAYWATVVTINITRLVPLAGDAMAALAGAPDGHVGALTLSRWFAIHVIVLPAAVATFVIVHLFLMRRHGISGPVRPSARVPRPFYPYQAARDVAAILAVVAVLLALAWRGMPPLERMADPTDATYVPRPEWYFLGLFQLLKVVPARLEIFGALVVPALVVLVLALLPWLDRGPERHPRNRRVVLGAIAVGLISVVALTAAAWNDRPRRPAPTQWTVRELAGATFAANRNCAQCHSAGRMAEPLGALTVRRPVAWLQNHFADPEVIAPGVRPLPPANEREGDALISFVKRGGVPPEVPRETRNASVLLARHCLSCHVMDGDGGSDGPDLTLIGRKHTADWLRRWIARPTAIRSDADMPAFEDKLSESDLADLARHLAARR